VQRPHSLGEKGSGSDGKICSRALDRGTQWGSRSQGNPREEQPDLPGAGSSHEQVGLALAWVLPAATMEDLNGP